MIPISINYLMFHKFYIITIEPKNRTNYYCNRSVIFNYSTPIAKFDGDGSPNFLSILL